MRAGKPSNAVRVKKNTPARTHTTDDTRSFFGRPNSTPRRADTVDKARVQQIRTNNGIFIREL